MLEKNKGPNRGPSPREAHEAPYCCGGGVVVPLAPLLLGVVVPVVGAPGMLLPAPVPVFEFSLLFILQVLDSIFTSVTLKLRPDAASEDPDEVALAEEAVLPLF